jgi:hypothetical protein
VAAGAQAPPQPSPNGQVAVREAAASPAVLTQREADFWRLRAEGKTVAEARTLTETPETTSRRYETRRVAAQNGAGT